MVQGLIGCELYIVESDLNFRGVISSIGYKNGVITFICEDGSSYSLYDEVHYVDDNRYFMGGLPRYGIVVDSVEH